MDFDRAIALAPDFGEAYHDRAMAWFYKGDYHRAWADVKRCENLGCEVNPDFIRRLRKASGRQD